ncbi:MAG: hypothetical protein P8Y70_12175 [Candidatus Lokiarchaeota archaeon]
MESVPRRETDYCPKKHRNYRLTRENFFEKNGKHPEYEKKELVF